MEEHERHERDETERRRPELPRPEYELPLYSLSRLLVFCVRCYQATLSPFIGNCCRFTPTCSQYYIEAVCKYGPIRGSLKGAWRILRCNPFCKGGYDPP